MKGMLRLKYLKEHGKKQKRRNAECPCYTWCSVKSNLKLNFLLQWRWRFWTVKWTFYRRTFEFWTCVFLCPTSALQFHVTSLQCDQVIYVFSHDSYRCVFFAAEMNATRFANVLFLLRAHLAGARETGASGDGEHSGAPADVKSFPYFIPAHTHTRSAVSCCSCSEAVPVTSPDARIQGVEEVLRDVEGVPGHGHHRAQTCGVNCSDLFEDDGKSSCLISSQILSYG